MMNHQTVFKVNPSNVNISEILKKEELTKNYLSETTSQRMKRFDSIGKTPQAQTIQQEKTTNGFQ